jgi:hypothetical protein
MRFFLQFHNPLIYILLAASAIKLAMDGSSWKSFWRTVWSCPRR